MLFFTALFIPFLFCRVMSQNIDSVSIVREKPEKILKDVIFDDFRHDGFNFWDDNFSGHWAGIDLGLNTFFNADYTGYSDPFLKNELINSNSLYINPIQQSIGLQKNRNTIGLVTGLGIHFRSYRLDQNTTIAKNPSGRVIPKTLIFEDNQKSKFSLVYVTLPLLAEFQIPLDHYKNRIFISGGILGSYRISSHTKIKYRLEGKREKLKIPGDFSLNDFRYSLMFRGGYRGFQLFTDIDLRPMFKKDLGPALNSFTFGITLISF